MGNVILQVTQNCNLRCEYCVYSGSYINRVHTNKRMSFETAVKTIDFLAAHSLNCNEVSIGFYGGEPLLEIELIKKAVSYAKEVFGEKKVNFNMTTNATLLNMDIADFLVQNDFNITISLDGPRNIHNKNRIFANSNKGTFDLIMENIALIREKYPFFDKKMPAYRIRRIISNRGTNHPMESQVQNQLCGIPYRIFKVQSYRLSVYHKRGAK